MCGPISSDELLSQMNNMYPLDKMHINRMLSKTYLTLVSGNPENHELYIMNKTKQLLLAMPIGFNINDDLSFPDLSNQAQIMEINSIQSNINFSKLSILNINAFIKCQSFIRSFLARALVSRMKFFNAHENGLLLAVKGTVQDN